MRVDAPRINHGWCSCYPYSYELNYGCYQTVKTRVRATRAVLWSPRKSLTSWSASSRGESAALFSSTPECTLACLPTSTLSRASPDPRLNRTPPPPLGLAPTADECYGAGNTCNTVPNCQKSTASISSPSSSTITVITIVTKTVMTERKLNANKSRRYRKASVFCHLCQF